jgi:hypothetical protein
MIDPKTNRERPERKELTPITMALRAAGSSPSEVARQAGVSPSTVTKVMLGQSRSAKIEALIESITGKPWDVLRAA